MASKNETELKFDADPGSPLPLIDGAAVLDERDIVLSAVYWDTADRRLLRWGASLRRRTASDGSEDGWTLKVGAPSRSVVDGVSRQEISAPGPQDEPPTHLVDVARALTLGHELEPQATITTRRQVRRLVASGGEGPGIELADDEVRSSRLGVDGPSFRQVEAELLDESAAPLLRAVGAQLRAAGFTPSAHTSKVEQVLGGPIEHPFTAAPLNRRSTVGELVPAVVGRGAYRLVAADPLVRIGDDPEAVHEARKAIRDLRSYLKALRPLLDRDRLQAARGELKWIGSLLGDLRDAQVLRGLFEDGRGALEPGEPAGVDDLRRRHDEQEAFRRGILLSALSGDRYVALLDDLESLVAQPPFRDDLDPEAPARRFVRRQARKSWKQVARRRRDLSDPVTAEELHELRKSVKQVRATAQIAGFVGFDATRFARRAGQLKDDLGDQHDMVVWMAWLEREHERFGPDGAFLAGRLHGGARERRRDLEGSWTRSWKSLADKRSTGWMR